MKRILAAYGYYLVGAITALVGLVVYVKLRDRDELELEHDE